MKCPRFAVTPMILFGLTVFSNVGFATTPIVTVTSPSNGSQDGTPVNFAATASSPDCSAGIAAMRIYTAPHVGAYTVDSNSLNVDLSLAPGTYNTEVQAWDNCGGVGKTPVNITVTGGTLPPPKFLYACDYVGGRIEEYNVNPNTGAITPTLQGSVLTRSKPEILASDRGGFRCTQSARAPTRSQVISSTATMEVCSRCREGGDGQRLPHRCRCTLVGRLHLSAR